MRTSSRLAMLSASESHEIPKTGVNGRESFVEVKGIGDGDVVVMVVQCSEGRSLTLDLSEGSTPLSLALDCVSYYFRKVAGTVPGPTSIWVVLSNDGT